MGALYIIGIFMSHILYEHEIKYNGYATKLDRLIKWIYALQIVDFEWIRNTVLIMLMFMVIWYHMYLKTKV